MSRLKVLGIAVVALGLMTAPAKAIIISWSGATLSGTGTANINTTGTLVEAHNVGSGAGAITAGTVLFDAAETNPLGAVFAGSNPTNITGDANFDAILNTASFAVVPSTYTIDGLITGQNYLVQFFTADSRSCCFNRIATLDDGDGGTISSLAMGNGYAFTGTFTALGATQDINFAWLSGHTTIPLINAWQLRTVPEPGTLALFGLGLAGLGFARRHKVS